MVLNTLNIQYKKMNIVSNEENLRVVKQCVSKLKTKQSLPIIFWTGYNVTVLIERKESNFGNKNIILPCCQSDCPVCL